MQKVKKAVALLAVSVMVIAMFAGCATTPATSSPAPASAPAAGTAEATTAAATTAAEATTQPTEAPADNPFKDPMEISFAIWGIGDAFNGKPDAVWDVISKDLNITIKPLNTTWDDWTQKIQTWAASGQLPDMFATDALGTANYKKWIDEGIVHVLPDDLSPYPNISKLMAGAGMDVYKYPLGDASGKYYSLPRLNHFTADEWACDTAVHTRKDWMTNVGVTKEPETMDEFIDLMSKYVSGDPDKNGKADTIGLTCFDASWLAWFLRIYEPGTTGWVNDPDNPGKKIPAFMTKNTLEGMKALKKLYDAGGLDKDFATLKGNEGRDKYVSNKAGAYAHDTTVSTISSFIGLEFEKMNPDIKYKDVAVVLKPFKSADGNYYREIANPGWSETYINATCDDKKVDRIMRFFDYVLGDKGYNLLHFGIEGTDYKVENGSIVLTPQKDADGKEIPLTVSYPITNVGYIAEWSGTRQFTSPSANPDLQTLAKAQNDWLIANAKPQPINLMIPLLDVPSKDKATENLKDDIIRCVLSDDVEKTFNELVANYRANGYDKLIEEVNAKCAELGIK